MIDQEKVFFRQLMGRFATGVAVVTTRSHGSLIGLTINSFCSVSLEPLVLVCIDRNSSTLSHFRTSSSFVINILTDQQKNLSRCFATSSVERYEDFCDTHYHLSATGSPIIDDALAFIDTHIVAEYPTGDHFIFVGQVETMGIGNQVILMGESDAQYSCASTYDGSAPIVDGVAPLLYYRGQYRHIAPDYKQPSLAASCKEPDYVGVGE